MQEPVPGAADSAAEARVGDAAGTTASSSSRPRHEPPSWSLRGATDVVVVVPALASTVEALTGAVDDRRAEAEQRRTGSPQAFRTRAAKSALTISALAVEDALRTFGADEIVVAGDDAMAAEVRGRVTIPVTRASEKPVRRLRGQTPSVTHFRHRYSQELILFARTVEHPALALVEAPRAWVVLEHPEDHLAAARSRSASTPAAISAVPAPLPHASDST